jgi:hypothetical protein
MPQSSSRVFACDALLVPSQNTPNLSVHHFLLSLASCNQHEPFSLQSAYLSYCLHLKPCYCATCLWPRLLRCRLVLQHLRALHTTPRASPCPLGPPLLHCIRLAGSLAAVAPCAVTSGRTSTAASADYYAMRACRQAVPARVAAHRHKAQQQPADEI